ncbi:MAG TPA: hypothetical protein VFE34_01130 [Dongiaceae bacterium]|jgi:hypothetical protein|nr:hypothetical protein [Dongiaceae bacterium]
MTVYVHKSRAFTSNRAGRNWLAKLLQAFLARRILPSTHKLPDYLLRDIGLQRVSGRVTYRHR